MKITNSITGVAVLVSALTLVEQVQYALGIIAITIAIVVNVVALFNKKTEKEMFEAEKEVHELEAELLRKKLKDE